MNTVEMVKGMRFNVKVRVPNTVAGWFQGRLSNAIVGSKALAGDRTVYELEGDVAPVYVAGGEASKSDPKFPDVPPFNESTFRNSLGFPSYMNEYEKWKPFLGDRALTTRNEWVLSALSTATNPCFDASKGLTGVASTNSAFYSPAPPTYDAVKGSIQYKVASPHFDETGAVAVGNYSLSMPVDAIKCLYNVSIEPSAAEISMSYDDGSEPYTATQTITKKDGWINVSVTGLHFSSPTVSTRFGTLTSDSANSAKRVFVVLMSGAQSATATATTGNYVKTVITGAKATITVTLTAKGTFSIYRKVGSKLVLLKKINGKVGANKYTTLYLKSYSFVVKDAKGKALTVKKTSEAWVLGISRFQ